jgi:putative salt-induced outer membrane protein YdiY
MGDVMACRHRGCRALVYTLGLVGIFSSAASADEIKLSSGEVLNVEILEQTPEHIRVLHPVLGELTLPRAMAEIIATPPSGEQPPTVGAQPAAPAAPSPEPESPIEPPPPPPEWKFKFILAAGMASGNTNNGNFSVMLTTVRETPTIRTAFDGGYFYSQTDGDRSQNRSTIGGRNDWLNPGSKWFYFVDGRYDNDEFQSWEARINSHIGLGYRLVTPPKLTLNALAGIGLVKEWGSDNEDVRPEGLIGLEGKYDFSDKHAIAFSSTVFPDLEDISEFRWVNSLGWSVTIEGADQLSLTAGLQHEHQTEVDEGRKKDDFRLFAGVQCDF